MDDSTPADAPEENLTRRTVAGVKWSYLASLVGGILQFGMTAVMARLLTPTAFGLIALASVVLRFADYFARAGVTQALIQKPSLSVADIRAAFALSAGLGGLFTFLALSIAPLAARILSEPDLTPVLQWLSLALLLNGLGAPSIALLRRALRFRELALLDVGSYVIGYVVVGLLMAIAGTGVYALVGAMLTQLAVKAAVSYRATRHPLLPTRSRAAYGAILSFGGRVSVISFFEFLQTNLDTLAVGRWVGSTQLGLYNRARMIGDLPTSQLTVGLSKVLFPSFSMIQLEQRRLLSAYISAVGAASAIVLPLNAGMAVAAREIVLVLLGPQWEGAIQVLPWLLLASTITLLGSFAGIVAEAQAALNAKLLVAIASTGALAVFLVAAQDRPLAWYGAAVAGAASISHIGYLWILSRTLETTFGSLVRPYARSLYGSLVVAGAIAACRWALLQAGTPTLLTLAGQVLTGAIVLAVLLRHGPLQTYGEDFASRLTKAGIVGKDAGLLGRTLRFLLGPASR